MREGGNKEMQVSCAGSVGLIWDELDVNTESVMEDAVFEILRRFSDLRTINRAFYNEVTPQ